jgi:diguanylate cyclase (GGDEF)-like protein
MPTIKREWCEITKSVINEAQNSLQDQLVNPVFAELPGVSIQDIAPEFFRRMRELAGFANEISISLSARSSESPDLPTGSVPLFKALFLQARLAKARELDHQRSKTTNAVVVAALEEQLKVYDDISREEWFQEAVPEYPLSLSDILTLERVEELDTGSRFSARQYDEKFHILQAPSLFQLDLHHYRKKCGTRRIPVSIAFLDIDKFKDFNSDVGETNVDRHVLPLFMRALELHIYGHGYAYRFGGDEYALLMPNANADLALTFVDGLRKRVSALRFVGTEKTITVSAGLCVADPDCHLTDGELLQKAERAKNFAKKAGRDRVAGYTGKLFQESDLQILIPTAQVST